MYVCGMTVYDLCHLGHARMLVVFDAVVRRLRARGFAVTYVRNITDIDDKIIQRANELDEPIDHLTERFIAAMHDDTAYLNIQKPDIEPRATEHIDEIVNMVARLEANGYAYRAGNGDVYYRVRRFEDYGQLSGEVDKLRSGARIDPGADKEDPLDFVLWKAAKPGEPSWPSPWGEGRPGWHIECSAMSTTCLGDHFDIHAGGMDLKFPHHENEIAQSEGATGRKFVNLWMHNGYVQVDKEKMSKSLGNFSTIRELLSQDTSPERMGEILRFMILASHYRSPLNYSQETLDAARASLNRLYLALAKARGAGVDPEQGPAAADYMDRYHAAMDDDFNTPEALSVVFDVVRELNRAIDAEDWARSAAFHAMLIGCSGELGLLYQDPDVFLSAADDEEVAPGWSAARVDGLVAERTAAREARDFRRADEIRDELARLGIVLEDRADGATLWRRH